MARTKRPQAGGNAKRAGSSGLYTRRVESGGLLAGPPAGRDATVVAGEPLPPAAPMPSAASGGPIVLEFSATLSAVVHAEDGGGYSAEVPALPGCHTEGETLDEVRANLIDAAEGWLKVKHDLAGAGRPAPVEGAAAP